MKIKLFRRKASPSSIGNGEPDSVVLFIHGLGGSHWTWNDFSSHLKLNWEETDSFGLEYDNYYQNQGLFHRIPVIKHCLKIFNVLTGPSIGKLSKHLKTVVDQVCNEYQNVIIVAHSMGGLVARQYIVDTLTERKSVGKVKALITYATPHRGSVWASYYATLVKYILYALGVPMIYSESSPISQLSKRSYFIDNLNKIWSNLRIDDKIDFKRVVAYGDWLVDATSSSLYSDPNVSEVANKDHFTIIKPTTRVKDPAFYVTYNYLKDFKTNLELAQENENEIDFTDEE